MMFLVIFRGILNKELRFYGSGDFRYFEDTVDDSGDFRDDSGASAAAGVESPESSSESSLESSQKSTESSESSPRTAGTTPVTSPEYSDDSMDNSGDNYRDFGDDSGGSWMDEFHRTIGEMVFLVNFCGILAIFMKIFYGLTLYVVSYIHTKCGPDFHAILKPNAGNAR